MTFSIKKIFSKKDDNSKAVETEKSTLDKDSDSNSEKKLSTKLQQAAADLVHKFNSFSKLT